MAFPEDNVTIPMSEYAKRLEVAVRKRYLDKISVIGIDPVLIDGKRFEPDYLPPVLSPQISFAFWFLKQVITQTSSLEILGV